MSDINFLSAKSFNNLQFFSAVQLQYLKKKS